MLGLLGLSTACGREKKVHSAVDDLQHSGAVAAPVKKLVQAVADNDSAGFAALVSYPLARPYPLHDIEDSAQMQKYYHILVDDSLRAALTQNGPEKWDHVGWRGWTLQPDHQTLLWIDSLLYDVPYMSESERVQLIKEQKRDMASIEPHYRDGWEPLAALKAFDGRIVRIDHKVNCAHTEQGSIRMMIFAPDSDLSGEPVNIYTGSLSTEGSALSPVYDFSDEEGNTAIWDADPVDCTENAPITFNTPEGNPSKMSAIKIYWLDLLNVR